jgi:polyene macrolide polyketide synthase
VLPSAVATGEPQLILRDGAASAARLSRRAPAGLLVPPAEHTSWRLETTKPGTIDALALVPALDADAPLGPREVRVSVRASGLNFRDVLIALGMYPGDNRRVGGEAAGIVMETGSAVRRVRVGDQVFGVVPGGFGPTAVADERTIARVPAGWTFEEAASVPVAFLSAYYGLKDLAALGSGESVLIHAATGGVGMAAVQLARHWGAEVFATASEGKWDTLRELGIPRERIASSRSLAFEETFRRATAGRGVDVVLNSLTGEYVDASLRLVAPGGRLAELGRRDVRTAGEIAAAFPTVLGYHAYELMDAGHDRVAGMLDELLELFAAGALRPLPVTTWDVRRAPDAFRFMSQARHTGKIVLRQPAPWDPEGTVLITGGTGTIGAIVARHLVTAHRMRNLVLVSRQGGRAEGAEELVSQLTALGARVTTAACDVTDRAAVSRLLSALSARCRPRGSIECCGPSSTRHGRCTS